MKLALALGLVVLAASACNLPEPRGPYRHCLPDSGFCWFEDAPPWERRRTG